MSCLLSEGLCVTAQVIEGTVIMGKDISLLCCVATSPELN